MDPLLARMNPDADVLLALCRANVDDAVLDAIAAADYGDSRSRHRAAIDAAVRQAPLQGALPWHPHEVLGLVRWSRPDEPQRADALAGLRRSDRHWARLLATTVLLRSARDGSENETLAALIDSAVALGSEAERAATRFVAWCPSRPGDGSLDAYFWFGLIALAVRAELPPDAAWIDAACARLEAMEAEATHDGPSSAWLLRITNHDQHHGLWQRLATRSWHGSATPPTFRSLCARVQPSLG